MTAVELIAWNLRRLRVARGLSQEALAVDAQVDRTHFSRIERGLVNPTVIVLERMALALDIRIVELFAVPRKGAKPPKPLPPGRKTGSGR